MTHPAFDTTEEYEDKVTGWWRTGISRIRPGEILLRGYPVEQLIGEVSFAEMIWLLLRGDLPSAAQRRLLEAALVAAVDHGDRQSTRLNSSHANISYAVFCL